MSEPKNIAICINEIACSPHQEKSTCRVLINALRTMAQQKWGGGWASLCGTHKQTIPTPRTKRCADLPTKNIKFTGFVGLTASTATKALFLFVCSGYVSHNAIGI
ncbi:MAG: hypothetical protein ABJH45_07015 [Paracoccaceae bacterium]